MLDLPNTADTASLLLTQWRWLLRGQLALQSSVIRLNAGFLRKSADPRELSPGEKRVEAI